MAITLDTLQIDVQVTGAAAATANLAQLAAVLARLGVTLGAFNPQNMVRLNTFLVQLNRLNTSGGGGSASRGGGGLKTLFRLGSLVAAFKVVSAGLERAIGLSNDYVENLNLFTVAMGGYAAEAQKYAEEVQAVMGIDSSDWMRAQGIFDTLLTGFGTNAEEAAFMSQNLTQLGYDLSSFFNIAVAGEGGAMQKLKSGIAGELEPLRALGFDLSDAKLKAIALANGITQSTNSMTQAQKAQLRYAAIMSQVTTAQGDMARTLASPANQLRILQAQLNLTARAIGNVFIPALSAIIPVAILFLQVVRLIAQGLAALFGFTLPSFDLSGVSAATGATDDLEDSLSGASGAAKELKGQLAGFDELTVISQTSGSGGSGSTGAGGGFGDLDLAGYDFLGGLTEVNTKAEEIWANMKKWINDVYIAAQPTIQALKDLWDSLSLLGTFVWTGLSDFYTEFLKPIGEWALGTGIPAFVSSITSLVKSVDWKTLNTSLAALWGSVSNFLTAVIGPGFQWLVDNFFVPIATWTINEAFPRILEVIRGILDSDVWAEFGATFADIYKNVLQPLAGAIGKALLDFLGYLADNGDGIARVLIAFAAGFTAIKVAGAVTTLVALADPVNILAAALVTLAAFNWDTITSGLGGTLNGIIKWWWSVEDWWNTSIAPLFTGEYWAGLFRTLWAHIANAFINPLIRGLNSALGWAGVDIPLIDVDGTAKGVKDDVKTAAKQGFKWAKDGSATWFNNETIPLTVTPKTTLSPEANTELQETLAELSTWTFGYQDTPTAVLTPKFDYTDPTNTLQQQIQTLVGSGTFSATVNAMLTIKTTVKEQVKYITSLTSAAKQALAASTTASSSISVTSRSGIATPQAFAAGGFPTSGQMFIANENGVPEMIGSFGNQAVVANNDQIVEGIASGVASANQEQNALLREQNALLRAILDKDDGLEPSPAWGAFLAQSSRMYAKAGGV